MVVVEEKDRAAPQNNWKPGIKSLLLGSGPKLPAAPASSNTTTTTIRCPECGSQRVWKDGLRHTPYGEIQRYICRNCGYRFSHSDPSEPSEHLQKLQSLILKSKAPIPLYRSRHGDLRHPRNGALKSTTVPEPKIRREPYNQYEAVNDMETRIQEKAAGATKPDQAAIKGKIVEFAWQLKKEGISQSTIEDYSRILRRLVQCGANIQDPESIKEVIALQEWAQATKCLAVATYQKFASINNIQWKPPKYEVERKIPFIPLEAELDALITGCGKKVSTLLALLKEAPLRIGEALRLSWIDVDLERNVLTLNKPEKHGTPRMFKISNKLTSMINALPKKSEKIFGNASYGTFQHNFYFQRRSLATKLQNPRLLKITFHTFRHWKATMEYHKTKDILHIMKLLGHKNIQNTLIYTQLITFESDDYHSAIADNVEEAKKLIESSFEYVCTHEGKMLFRKRK